MERVFSLLHEGKALREIAERCKEYPDFYQQMIALAQRCDDMAAALNSKIDSKAVATDPDSARA